MSTSNIKGAFFVARVGAPVEFTNTRKDDGETFVTTKYPLTLVPVLGNTWRTDIQYNFWTASAKVAKAVELLAEKGEVLTLENDIRDFRQGDIKMNSWITKSGEQASQEQMTVWLDASVEPIFGTAARPRKKDDGNIGDILARFPKKAESAVKPADGGNAPF